jgi:hypothetical protein
MPSVKEEAIGFIQDHPFITTLAIAALLAGITMLIGGWL